MKTINLYISTLIIILFASSCSDDDDNIPEVINEEEVITTMNVTLVPDNGGATITLQSRDLDGDGPDAPVLTVSGPLATNQSYTGSIELLNETESPAEDVTEEVEEEGEEHQFFFALSEINASVTYADQDANGNPIGIDFNLITQEASSGSISITLRHEPAKDAAGVSNGDITNAGGETDIQQVFNIVVE